MHLTADQHPSHSDLAAFALGKLNRSAVDWVGGHLADCSTCRNMVEQTPNDSLVKLLKGAGPGRVPGTGDTGPWVSGTDTGGAFAPPAAPIDPDDMPPALRDHPRYRILRLLGRGGMGVVYQAEHKVMERLLAVKVINRAFVDHPEAIERFNREVRAAAKLDHPNIVKAYDAEQAGDLQLLAMEFVEGKSLADVLHKKGPLPVANACHYVRQAALGLQHAFERGMVHRDLKPQNLMLTPKGVVKILDFGLAKLASESARPGGGLTQDNMVMGTPEYMAPEQAISTKTADIRADIYALGCTLYCLLTGRPPFAGDPLAIIVAHSTDAPAAVESLRPEVPAALAALLQRMLAKKPDDRPQPPKEVAEALAPFSRAASKSAPSPATAVPSPTAVPPSGLKNRRWFIPSAVAAGLLLAVGVVAAVVMWLRVPGGVVKLEVEPVDAKVEVVDGKITISRPGDAEPWRIELAGDKGQLKISKAGFVIETREVTLGEKGQTIRVELKPDATVKSADAFVPLFNGKDLTGWKTHDKQPGNWRVEKGILIGSGPDDSYLYTARGDYKNYHLRVEARINEGGDGGVFLRSPFGPVWPVRDPSYPSGYEAQINSTYKDAKTGSLFVQNGPGSPPGISVKDMLIPAGQWFVMEVIAEDNHLVIKVDGKTTADYSDEKRTFVGGHIALQKNEHVGGQKNATQTVVEFRKIEIKELGLVAAVLAPEKSEWAGNGVLKDQKGERRPISAAWTITERRGHDFKALSRSGFGYKAIFEGVIDANGRIKVEARESLAPDAKPREAIQGTGEVGSERMTVFVGNPDTGATWRVEFKRLSDGGESFNFQGRWKCFHQPNGWNDFRTIREDSVFSGRGTRDGPWERDGGLIITHYPNGGREWLIIDPDKPNELHGTNGSQSVTWIRQ